MEKPTKVVRVDSAASTSPPQQKQNQSNFGTHFVGILVLFPLLIFHFLCFIVIVALAIGVGILASVLHEILWDTKFAAFWQTYVTLVTIFICVEIFFRVGFRTSMNNWMNRQQEKHRIELYYIPRGLYAIGYMVAICLLYYAYQGAHKVLVSNPALAAKIAAANMATGNGTTTTTTSTTTTTAKPVRNSTFDGEGDDENAWKTDPLSLSPTEDHFHYSMIFFISLCYMIYTISKENDWITHRRTVMEKKLPDPVMRGGVVTFMLFLAAHVLMTLIYILPLLGTVFLARQFQLGPILTFTSGKIPSDLGIFMAILVGIGALYIERRRPFPTKPMQPPGYAYENHLRIRIAILQLGLLPLAAGRYFDANRSLVLDSENDDFLMFVGEVSIGVVQVLKICGNDLFLLKAKYCPSKRSKGRSGPDGVEEDVFGYPSGNSESILSINQSSQTIIYDEDIETYKEESATNFAPSKSTTKVTYSEPEFEPEADSIVKPYQQPAVSKSSLPGSQPSVPVLPPRNIPEFDDTDSYAATPIAPEPSVVDLNDDDDDTSKDD